MEQNQSSDTQSNKGSSKTVITVAVVAVIALAVMGFVLAKKKSDDTTSDSSVTTNSTTPAATEQAPTSQATPATDAAFKDGTYNATGDYDSPAGMHSLTVKVTLKNGAVEDVTTTGDASDRASKEYLTKFLDAYKSQVVGKKLDGLKLDRVAGSSLTPKGFNEAISKIQTQAKG